MAETVTFKGNPMHLVGNPPKEGESAPDVTLTTTDLEPLKLSDLRGKVAVLSITPSLDTSVCQTMCRRFDHEAAQLSDDVVVLNVSEDLPFAVKRFCGEGLEQIKGVSDYREREFGEKFGLLIDELKLLARAVYVLDRDGKVVYREIVSEVADEPDYDAALEAARKAV